MNLFRISLCMIAPNTAYSAREHWSFDESFKFLCRGLLVFICTTGWTLCLHNFMVFWTDWPWLDCHTRLCNSTVRIPFTQGPLLNHSSWNPSLQTVFSALESSSSFKKANHAITAPGMVAYKFIIISVNFFWVDIAPGVYHIIYCLAQLIMPF